MAVDKLVDSTQLDADLTSVANAIRAKGGTSESLAFPAGFVSAVEAIEKGGGGGISADDIADHTIPGAISLSVAEVKSYSFYAQTITGVTAPNVTTLGTYSFAYCRALGTVKFPEVTTVNGYAFAYAGGTTMDNTNCILVFPKLSTMGTKATFDRGRFIAIDIGPDLAALTTDAFYHNTSQQIVGTLILRRTDSVVSSGLDGLKGLRDVYVPSALISEYEAATNWSARVSGGYITFHAIEGSQYENYYADGTPIT